MPNGFRTPETRQEAELRLEKVRADIQAIQRQLDDETRAQWYLETDRTQAEYNNWRTMAVRAKTTKGKEQASLEAWLSKNKRERQAWLTERIIGDPDSTEAHLRAMYLIVRAAVMEKRLTLDKDEAVAFAKVRDFLSESAFAATNGNGEAKDTKYKIVGADAEELVGIVKRRSSAWNIIRRALNE